MSVRILTGDCRDVLKTLLDASIDSIVTDPPYHLTTGKKGGTGEASVNLESPYGRARIGTGFMGMKWDGGDVAFQVELWAECLRVLKPGGHLLAFGGTRTQHRMVCAIEDAGFEIRDQAGWMYGSGFPKSLDVSKAIDKAAGAARAVVGTRVKAGIGGSQTFAQDPWTQANRGPITLDVTAPATADAAAWQGWGTALKPAWEPICVARKPLIGTVAANVQAHGTGAINVDGCRITVSDDAYARNHSGDRGHAGTRGADEEGATNLHTGGGSASALGRWPANLLHDGSPEVAALFPREAGAAAPVTVRNGDKFRGTYGAFAGNIDEADSTFHADTGSAARFFWCPKTSKADRNEGLEGLEGLTTDDGRKVPLDNAYQRGKTLRQNTHPTVKPTELMRYLCRLVTPPGGTVLDPFAGSGSTLKAAELEGFSAIGIELDPAYVEIARRRIAADAPLFAEVSA